MHFAKHTKYAHTKYANEQIYQASALWMPASVLWMPPRQLRNFSEYSQINFLTKSDYRAPDAEKNQSFRRYMEANSIVGFNQLS
jgi:hypothetical protein